MSLTVPRMSEELHFVNRVASELFIARTIIKPKYSTLMKVTSSPQYLLFGHEIQKTVAQAVDALSSVTQKIMDLYVTQGSKAGPEIRRFL